MTAHDTTHARSHNSVSQTEARALRPEHRLIIDYVDRTGPSTREQIAVRAGWTLEKTTNHLEQLADEGELELVQSTTSTIILPNDGDRRAPGGAR